MELGSTDTVIVSCLLLLATPGLRIQSNAGPWTRGVRRRTHKHTKRRDRGGTAVKYGTGDKEERGTP